MRFGLRLVGLFCSVVLFVGAGCISDEKDSDTVSEADTDTDTDADTDSDTDADADADSDTDTDVETFACGELECRMDQYCYTFMPGVRPETGAPEIVPECMDAPAECAADLTCACLADRCTDCTEANGVQCTMAAP